MNTNTAQKPHFDLDDPSPGLCDRAGPRRGRLRLHLRSRKAYGRFSKVHVCYVLPDPGALNYFMHALPYTNDGSNMLEH